MSDEEGAQAPQMVPLDRLNKAIEARKAAESRAKEYEARIAELEPLAGTAEQLREKLAATAKSHADEIARRDSQLSFVRAGVDDEEIQTVLLDRWRAMDAKDRPTLGEWLAEGAREDKIASRFFAEAAAAPAETAAPAPAAAPIARTNAGAAPTPPAAREMDRATYYERLQAARTPAEKRAVMAEYMAQR
jgi:hypothetical protein